MPHDSARKAVDSFNSRYDTELFLFAPTYVVKDERAGEVRFRELSLTFHYVFVKGTPEIIKRLCSEANGFSFLINRGSEERYAIVEDSRMMHFMNIARAYKNCLPYFPLDDIDLEEGDLVEVVKGDFPGLVGTFMPKAKGRAGDVVLRIYNDRGTIAFDVKATDVRVLKFSEKSTRANDQIDAFVPHLFKALRLFSHDEALTTPLAAKLAMFCGRMGLAEISNNKLNARLQILLYAANHIIGNIAEADSAFDRFEKVKESVTNQWTLASVELIRAVIAKDKSLLTSGFGRINVNHSLSRMQRMLMEEYDYYLAGLAN